MPASRPALPAAVVVTHDPPPGLPGRLAALARQVGRIVVVDNASPPAALAQLAPLADAGRIVLLRNAANLGIAAALNQGIADCARAGHDWVLLLDHDSEPQDGMVEAMLPLTADAGAAAIVPGVRYGHREIRCRWPQTVRGWRFRFVHASALTGPTPVDLAISSGMLLRTAAVDQLGGFDEGLFIDLVDTEWCLRARLAGWRIVAAPGAWLQHALGAVEQRRVLGLKVYPTHHGALRHYYINRNRQLLYRRYARALPAWAAYETSSAAKLLAKVILFEGGKLAKLGATLQGTLDGLLGRTGPRS